MTNFGSRISLVVPGMIALSFFPTTHVEIASKFMDYDHKMLDNVEVHIHDEMVI